MQVQFIVNGQRVQLDVDPATPLAIILRNELDLRGTRLGCAEGNCGACTVTLGGRAVQSCSITADMLQGQEVVTIDALVESDPPHPLVEALLTHDAGQCGFCLAGIVMSVYPLYGHAEEQGSVQAALERNLCRCGAHTRITRALDAALAEGVK